MGVRYRQIYDGEPRTVSGVRGYHHVACCDCGLVHRFTYRIKGSTVVIRAWRDNRATAAKRRRPQVKR